MAPNRVNMINRRFCQCNTTDKTVLIVIVSLMVAIVAIFYQIEIKEFIIPTKGNSTRFNDTSCNCSCPPALINETYLKSLLSELWQKTSSLKQEEESKKALQQELKSLQTKLQQKTSSLKQEEESTKDLQQIHAAKQDELNIMNGIIIIIIALTMLVLCHR